MTARLPAMVLAEAVTALLAYQAQLEQAAVSLRMMHALAGPMDDDLRAESNEAIRKIQKRIEATGIALSYLNRLREEFDFPQIPGPALHGDMAERWQQRAVEVQQIVRVMTGRGAVRGRHVAGPAVPQQGG